MECLESGFAFQEGIFRQGEFESDFLKRLNLSFKQVLHKKARVPGVPFESRIVSMQGVAPAGRFSIQTSLCLDDAETGKRDTLCCGLVLLPVTI